LSSSRHCSAFVDAPPPAPYRSRICKRRVRLTSIVPATSDLAHRIDGDYGKANTAPFSMLNGLAMVRAVTRSTALAGEVRVLARAARRRAGSKLSPDEMVRIAVVAAAANREGVPWAVFLGEWLTELAFIDMTYDEAVGLQGDPYALLYLEPVLWETSGRAEAALSALVQSFPDA
jgi:hypothetical protein